MSDRSGKRHVPREPVAPRSGLSPSGEMVGHSARISTQSIRFTTRWWRSRPFHPQLSPSRAKGPIHRISDRRVACTWGRYRTEANGTAELARCAVRIGIFILAVYRRKSAPLGAAPSERNRLIDSY